ncbi:helix-turn-helix transcriptional regulator [Chryseobacterium sp. 7]|uniref:helix-turn-helix transcriptional regulator n=1 Tax=Chryseobacterium sp. 7 TaxID=2035214 RepID=UPI000EB2BC6D|nr:LuxR C-terminal-related transcriptional regulator [Chryseobacterium sp. 7]
MNKIKELCSKINDTELEVCALIKLGLTTKEIAIATNSTYKAIESIKYRVRKKLNLDSGINLMLFFNEI